MDVKLCATLLSIQESRIIACIKAMAYLGVIPLFAAQLIISYFHIGYTQGAMNISGRIYPVSNKKLKIVMVS